jgi:CHASE3 domain sensor protein
MKTKSLLNRRVHLALGATILALLVVGAISYQFMIASTENNRFVRHTHEVLEKLQDLLFAMQSMESSYRGFVLTGAESNLESYRASTLSAGQDAVLLRNLTADNPEQQRRIPTLERLAAQQIQYAQAVIGRRRTMGLEAAADVT